MPARDRKRRLWAALLVLLFGLAAGGLADVPDRFPRPEFESGYETPYTTTPAPWFGLRVALDIVLLATFLGLAGWLGIWRRSRRGLVLLALAAVGYFGFWRKGCVCPIGAIQNVVLAVVDAGYALPLVVLVFFVLPLVFAIFVGRGFCAAVCPLGAIQELVLVRPVHLPRAVNSFLAILPMAYLGLAVLLVASGAGFIICQFDPFIGIYRMGGTAFTIGLGVAFLAVGIFIGRPYCRLLCPYGVLLGWLSKLNWRHVQITPQRCISCKLCEHSCPYGAILPPKEPPANVRQRRERRVELVRLLLLWPVLILAFAALGHAMAPLFDALRLWMSDIHAEPGVNMRLGSTLYGAFVGFCAGLLALREPLRRPTPEFAIDPVHCHGCARCFADCPIESECLLRGDPPIAAAKLPGERQ